MQKIKRLFGAEKPKTRSSTARKPGFLPQSMFGDSKLLAEVSAIRGYENATGRAICGTAEKPKIDVSYKF